MKRKICLKYATLFVIISCITSESLAQVGVNILTPNQTSALQIESPVGTSKGLLTPSMTTIQRASIKTGTIIPGDGLVVYDVNHHMHYAYSVARNSWISLSPFTLTTSPVSTTLFPYGVITTPSSSATFSVGINKQNPVQALDVVGNATVSGNVTNGGNLSVGINATVAGNASVNGTLSVNGFPANALVPAGVITMFSGTLIPNGWAICDGGVYNGLQTPDLRGRFIVGMESNQGAVNGMGQYIAVAASNQTPTIAPNDGLTNNYGKIGNRGGEIGHILSLPEMPSHTHSVTAILNNPNNVVGAVGAWVGGGGSWQIQTQTSSITISESVRGADQTHENRPPYYVLVYIIKLP